MIQSWMSEQFTFILIMVRYIKQLVYSDYFIQAVSLQFSGHLPLVVPVQCLIR